MLSWCTFPLSMTSASSLLEYLNSLFFVGNKGSDLFSASLAHFSTRYKKINIKLRKWLHWSGPGMLSCHENCDWQDSDRGKAGNDVNIYSLPSNMCCNSLNYVKKSCKSKLSCKSSSFKSSHFITLTKISTETWHGIGGRDNLDLQIR